MKILLTALAWAIATPLIHAQPIKPIRVESELGDAIGVSLYRFEAELKADEVLVVRERIHEGGHKEVYFESVVRPAITKAVYPVTLINSGVLHPSFRGDYIIRENNGSNLYKESFLRKFEQGGERLLMILSDESGTTLRSEREWSAKVETHAAVKQRHPNLPPLKAGMGITSRFVIEAKK